MYRLVFLEPAHRQLKKIDRYAQNRIRLYLDNNVDGAENPRLHGKALHGNLAGYWRYRVGDYRVICQIKDDICEVIAVQIGHRSKVYF